MPSTPFDRSRLEHPGLPRDILRFFDLAQTRRDAAALQPRTVQAFVSASMHAKGGVAQPAIVVEVCRRLVRRGWLSEVGAQGLQGLGNRYLSINHGGAAAYDDPILERMTTCAVYGYPAIHALYGPSVVPLVNVRQDNPQIGTAFVAHPHCLVTAAHCVTPADGLAIHGATPEQLREATVWMHAREALDVAIVQFREPVYATLAPPALPVR